MLTQVAYSKVQAGSDSAAGRVVRTEAITNPAATSPAPGTQSTAGGEQTAPVPAVQAAELESAVSQISERAQNMQRALQFSVDEDSGETVITVIDRETREVIRRIPPDEVVGLAERFGNGPGGLLKLEA